MSTGSTYPAEMASTLVTQWEERGLPSRLLPSQTSLETLLDVAYQASLLLEEGDQVRCRIVVADTAELAHPERENPGTPRILPFAEPMALTPHTIRKLSAAAGYFGHCWQSTLEMTATLKFGASSLLERIG